MRIIAGKFRGKKLSSPKHDIRPTLDMVKQAIFTRLQFFVPGTRVLDLFAGSGALGIEAISRGAESVVFCDNNYKSIALVKENLNSIGQQSRVLSMDYKSALTALKGEQFDLIFVDPPYASGVYQDVLSRIKEFELLANDGVIVCEHGEEPVNSDLFKMDAIKKYGSVYISYMSHI